MTQRFRKSRYRKEARTIRLRASDGDSGREMVDEGNYFRCWHCGFICDIRRDELSSDGRRGTAAGPETPLQADRVTNYARGADAILLSAEVGHDIVLTEENASGDPVTVYRVQTAKVERGCPLCGTTNYKKQ